MEDKITTNKLNGPGEIQNTADQLQSVRAELLTLAEKREIKYSAAYIKKAGQKTLEKIKGDYERKTIGRDERLFIRNPDGKIVRIYGSYKNDRRRKKQGERTRA